MASIGHDKNGRRRILFVDQDGSRKTIRLGKVTAKQAAAFKIKLEALIGSRFTGNMDDEVSRWVAALPDDVHGKLAAVGLVPPRVSLTLGEFLDGYLRSRDDLKPNSQLVYGHTRRTLIEFFGYDKPLRAITEEDAKLWRQYLIGQGLSEATVCKRCGNAKVFFGVAVKRKLIPSNPFSELESRSIANKSRQRFISREDAQKVLDACPDAEWRLIFALCRYGGLRCPSEVLALRWQDIDWERGRIHVTSPKTEHFEGRGSRDIPLFPELRQALMEMFEQASDGAEFCIGRYRKANANLRTEFERIIRRAGLSPWPRLFQNLRSTCETELAAGYPLHVATYWVGNTARIAERHYLQVPDEHFARATQNPAQSAAGTCSNARNTTPERDPENGGFLHVTAAYKSLQDKDLETKGIEPSFRRCDRRVLPLHHVPRILSRYSMAFRLKVKLYSNAVRKITYRASELPFFETGDAIHGLAPVLFGCIGRITERQKLDNCRMVRDADNGLHLIGIERADPASGQS